MPSTTVELCTGLEVNIDYEVTEAEPDVGVFHPYVDADSITIYRPQPDGSGKEVHKDAYWILGESLNSIAETLTENLGD